MTKGFDEVTKGAIAIDPTVPDLAYGKTVLSVSPGKRQDIQAEMRITNDPKFVEPGERLGRPVDVPETALMELNPGNTPGMQPNSRGTGVKNNAR